MSSHACHNQRILWPGVFLKSPSKMPPLWACPHQSQEVATPKTKVKVTGIAVVKANDCLLMQLIHQLDLQTQIQPLLRPNQGQELNQPMRLIPMQTHVAWVTILQSLSTQLSRWMFTLMTNPSSPSQMCQLCPAQLLGMIQFHTKPMFWLLMRPFVMALNWTAH